ncbi:X-ray radiation resistance-associated protein 1-like [Clavelina lepadiformis]
MSSLAVWKLESANSYPTNSFPARGVARKLHESAGSWVVAYAEKQQSKFQASFNPRKPNNLQSNLSTAPRVDRRLSNDKSDPHIFDAGFLLKHHHVDSALDLCSVNVSDQNLEDVNEEEFKDFINVAYINASENLLPFRPFNHFINLRELELPVNGLRNLKVEYGDFPNLQVLDLSYNYISAKDVLDLGVLAKLKVLTLTGNGMHSIHTDMARPIVVSASGKDAEIIPRFKNLEVLLLDDNNLDDLSTFASLAALPQLRELNLDKNGIELIPHLKVIGDKVISETHSSLGHHKSAPSSGRKSRSSRRSSKRGKPPLTEESMVLENKRSMATSTTFLQPDKSDDRLLESSDSTLTVELQDDLSTPSPPFQNLRLLSIANNQITEEECVLAVVAWPRLGHLVMHGNPIVKHNSGEPPLLSHYLRHRLGINIHRFRPKAPLPKPHLTMPDDRDRKVTTVVPKIPKQPVDVLIKSLMGSTNIGQAPTKPPHAEAQPSKGEKGELPPMKAEATTSKDKMPEESVFLTQIDEIPMQPRPPSTPKPKKMKSKNKSKAEPRQPEVEEKFKGLELLLDAKPDPTLHQPIGIQGNVRALHSLLSHPTVYRSSDVTLDRVLPYYQAKSSRHDRAQAVARERGKEKRPDKKEKLGRALVRMRDRNAISAEMPLADAIEEGSNEISAEEADQLLMEVEEKYRVVREESLRASRQAQRTFQETKNLVHSLQ